ncbi:MAG: phosphoesterase [Richelia sp. RM2_1_2]|nr:phosphoesterase [Richelia sp. RM2_1_2]
MFNKDKIHFTSDSHFYHFNIIRYCNRPFQSVTEMNETMISRWNERVKKDDVVYHLGDIFLGTENEARSIISRLNGTIYLIEGNHERTALSMRSAFGWVRNMFTLKVNDTDAPRGIQEIVMCHYAMLTWNKAHHGAWHIFGHSHRNLNPWIQTNLSQAKMVDVGVDNWNFYPVSYNELKAHMDKKKGQAVDHHEQNGN